MTSALALINTYRRLLLWLGAGVAGVGLLLLGRVSPLLALAAPVLGVVLFTVMRRPVVGFALLLATIPVQDMGAVGSGEASVTATRGALVLAVFGYFATLVLAQRRLDASRTVLPFAALLFWLGVTAATARDQLSGAAELFRWTTAFLAFVLAVQFLSRARDRTIVGVIGVTAAAGAIEAAVGSILGILGFGPVSFQVGSTFARAYGTFGRPNTFGGYLEMTVFPALWLAVYSLQQTAIRLRTYRAVRVAGFHGSADDRRAFLGSLWFSAFLLVTSALMFGGVLISFSRGAWLGVGFGLIVSIVVALRRFWVTLIALTPIAALVIVFALGQLGSSLVGERFGSILDEARPFDAATVTITPDNFAVAERMAHWQAGWRMFVDDPLTGVGAGNFNPSYPDYFVRSTFRFSQGHAHNFYIHMLAENGLPGLFLYLTLASGFLLLALTVALRSEAGLARALALGALGSMSAVYLHNVFENLHVLNLSVQISFVWALSVIAHRRWRTGLPPGHANVEYSRR